MAEDNGGTVVTEGTGGTGAGHEASGGTAGQGESRAEARIRTLSDANKELAAQLAKYESANRDRETEALKARGKFEELESSLKAELEAARKKAEAWDAYQSERQDTLINTLPEEDRHLAEGLPLAKLEALVARLAQNTQIKPNGAAASPGGAGGVPLGAPTPEEIRKNAGNPEWMRANWARMQQQT